MNYYFEKNNEYVYYGDNWEFLKVVNEEFNLAINMKEKTWLNVKYVKPWMYVKNNNPWLNAKNSKP